MPADAGAASAGVVWFEPFDVLDSGRWRQVEVRGRTEYSVVDLDGRRCLKAESRGAASILLSSIIVDPKTDAWLSWEWRVDQLVDGEALGRKAGSDAAARVYVYFDSPGMIWQRHSIDYVWSASLPVGTVLDSAFSSASKILVAESGPQTLGQWRAVVRNIDDDYERCFGKEPPKVIAVGVMSDTDNTRGAALAYFDELRISRVRPKDR